MITKPNNLNDISIDIRKITKKYINLKKKGKWLLIYKLLLLLSSLLLLLLLLFIINEILIYVLYYDYSQYFFVNIYTIFH